VADYKRKEKERMSDEEKKQAENEEREKRYAELEKQIALRDYADYLDDVTDLSTKTKIVELLADGKITEALDKFKQYRVKDKAEIEKKVRSELLQQNPQPNPQSTGGGYKTKAEIMAIKDTNQRQKAIAENMHLFK
jgi:hypothetical protein